MFAVLFMLLFLSFSSPSAFPYLQELEFQYYNNNRSNSFIEDGNLNIRPTLTAEDFGELFLYSGTLDLHER
jgi:hypothetical protein